LPAKALVAAGPVWIAKTVLIGTAWFLRGTYGFEKTAVCKALTNLLGLDDVSVEDEASVIAALELAGQGLGFADAMHFCSTPPGATFVSFDRSFIRRARHAGHRTVALCGE